MPFSIVEAVRAGEGPHNPARGCLDCPHSLKGNCDIYPDRPLMCRLFATTHDEQLTCPHGAKAEKLLTKDESNAIVDEYSRILQREDKSLLLTPDKSLEELRAHRRSKK